MSSSYQDLDDNQETQEKCNDCEYGRYWPGEQGKSCSMALEPMTCDHDLEKFEDD